ncbi:hypothetical protein [Mycobacterium colombiense]|uniref:hypothetical protein n=1 Tax=Mycobacterium colombiense TaxID=339268 RepID=UPI0012DB3D67|nr:hypothetical protein [Mycobacterium colombiense]
MKLILGGEVDGRKSDLTPHEEFGKESPHSVKVVEGAEIRALDVTVCAIGLAPVIAARPSNGAASDRKGMNNNRTPEVGEPSEK